MALKYLLRTNAVNGPFLQNGQLNSSQPTQGIQYDGFKRLSPLEYNISIKNNHVSRISI